MEIACVLFAISALQIVHSQFIQMDRHWCILSALENHSKLRLLEEQTQWNVDNMAMIQVRASIIRISSYPPGQEQPNKLCRIWSVCHVRFRWCQLMGFLLFGLGCFRSFYRSTHSVSSVPDCVECMYRACAPSLSYVFSWESVLGTGFYFLRVNDTVKFQ